MAFLKFLASGAGFAAELRGRLKVARLRAENAELRQARDQPAGPKDTARSRKFGTPPKSAGRSTIEVPQNQPPTGGEKECGADDLRDRGSSQRSRDRSSRADPARVSYAGCALGAYTERTPPRSSVRLIDLKVTRGKLVEEDLGNA